MKVFYIKVNVQQKIICPLSSKEFLINRLLHREIATDRQRVEIERYIDRREKEIQAERETEKEIQAERETEKEIQAERETEKERYRQREIQAERDTEKDRDRETALTIKIPNKTG